MICPKCGNEMNEGAKFCRKCGTKQEAPQSQEAPQPQEAPPDKGFCANCGTAYNPAEDAFCLNCGAKTTGTPPPVSPPQPPVLSNTGRPKKMLMIGGGAGLLIVIVVVIIIAVSSGGDSDYYTPTPTPAAATTPATPTPVPQPQAPAQAVTVLIQNNTSDMTFTQLYFSPADAETWGGDYLTGFDMMAPTQYVTLTFSAKELKESRYWNLKVVDYLSFNGGEISFSSDIDLWEVTEIYINENANGTYSLKCL